MQMRSAQKGLLARLAMAAACATVLFGALPAPALAQTVVGGSFESPELADGSVLFNPNLHFTGSSGIAHGGSAFGMAPELEPFGVPPAVDGDQNGFLQTGSREGFAYFLLSVEGLVVGHSYYLSFYSQQTLGNFNSLTINFGNDPAVTIIPLSEVIEVETPAGVQLARSLQYTLPPSIAEFVNTSVSFHTQGGTEGFIGIDRVTLRQVPSVSAVPEPATWAYMIFGFGAVCASMRATRKIQIHRRVTHALS